MMNNELIERYIYAVTKRLPAKSREDVSNELRTLIEDMLEEKCGDITPVEKDIKVVLTELGTPDELADKYDTSTHKYLIGPPYFSTYKFVLKIVLICMVIGLVVSGIITAVTTPSDFLIEAGVEWVATIISGLTSAFAIVTIIFAFFSYKGIKLNNFSFDELPAVPQKKQEISRIDCVMGICTSVIFLVIFLIVPQCVGAYMPEVNEFVPIFNVDVIRSVWYIPALFSIAGISREIIKLIEGRYNKKVMITTIVDNAISAVVAAWWLIRDNIINPEFIGALTGEFQEEIIIKAVTNFELVFLGAMLVALALDTIVAIIKTLSK